MVIDLVAEAVASGAREQRACAELGISLRTLERWRQRRGREDMRAGPRTEPRNKLTEGERRKVLEIVNRAEFENLSPNEIVPKLADRGEYVCSEATMYRVLKEAKQLAHRGRNKAPVERKPIVRVATKPNQVWSWDITYLRSPIRGRFYYLYLVMDIWSRQIVGWAVHEEESAQHASRLIERAAHRQGIGVDALTLHSDNGSPMKGSTMLATLQRLGIIPSFTRPRVCDDNPFSEALFRTLKYRPSYPDGPFSSVVAARTWVEDFVRWYNYDHLHSGICFIRPVDRHQGRDQDILDRRKATYEAAKARRPDRWGSRDTRAWVAPSRVCVRGKPGVADRGEAKAA